MAARVQIVLEYEVVLRCYSGAQDGQEWSLGRIAVPVAGETDPAGHVALTRATAADFFAEVATRIATGDLDVGEGEGDGQEGR